MIQFLQATLVQKVSWRRIVYLVAGALLLGWLLYTPPGLLGKADAVGYAVCHRIDPRSFHLGDRQLPMCARCSGQYLGAMLGIVYQIFFVRRRVGRPPWGVIAVLGSFVAIYGIDGLNSYLHLLPEMSRFYLYEPNNTLRLLTGTGLGLGVSIAMMPAFHQTMWRHRNPNPAVEGFWPLFKLIAVAMLLDVLVLTGNPLVLYPLALVTSAGVLVLLTMVYAMVWVMLFRMENRFERVRELLFPLAAGFIVALLQIAAMDYVRYFFFGTWEGFHFG